MVGRIDINRPVLKSNYPIKIVNGVKKIDYDAWMKRIIEKWPDKNMAANRSKQIRNLCQIF